MKIKSNMKILVLDGDVNCRNLVKLILTKRGFKNVITACDGEQAFQILNAAIGDESPVEMILADWNMPNINGLEFFQQVRQIGGYEKTPFILVSGNSEQKEVLLAIRAGVSNFVLKPITPDTLMEKIVAVLSR